MRAPHDLTRPRLGYRGAEEFGEAVRLLVDRGWRPVVDLRGEPAGVRYQVLCLYGIVVAWRDEEGRLWTDYGRPGQNWPVHGVMFREVPQ